MTTCYESLTLDQCNSLLSSAEGLKVSRFWRSVEPGVFFELGRLSRKGTDRRKERSGQITLMVESVWRVEGPRSIHFGSSFSATIIEKRLADLVGLHVSSITADSETREMRLQFSDGRIFRTFCDWSSQPRWTVLFNDASLLPMDAAWQGVDVTPCLHISAGRPEIEYCFDEDEVDMPALVALVATYRSPPN